MLKLLKLSVILVAIALGFDKTMAVEPSAKLTIVVNDYLLKGEVCMRIYTKSQSFHKAQQVQFKVVALK